MIKDITGFEGGLTTCGKHRVGDIRHCIPNVNRAKERLGWEAKIGLESGLKDLLTWATYHVDKKTNHKKVIEEAEKYGLLWKSGISNAKGSE
jgi:dTDP-L-rhamnose 4-epimerase